MEFIFEIRDAEGGGICAGALGHAIFAEGETWQELRANVLEAGGCTARMAQGLCKCIT